MARPSLDSTDLPELAPRTQCVLIPRDPNFIYAYWNFTQDDLDRAPETNRLPAPSTPTSTAPTASHAGIQSRERESASPEKSDQKAVRIA